MADPKPKPDTGFRSAVIPQTKTAAPPGLPPLPAPKSKTTSQDAAFNSFINAHPTMRPYSIQIGKWAKVYGVDKTVMAALFWRESFAAAKAQGKDPATIVSPAGAVGIGQIMPLHVGEKTPWGHTVTTTDLTDPGFNIQWSSWYFSKQVAKYGSVDAAYNQGYNPGYTGAALTSLLPKGYVPKGSLSPTDKGTVAAETAAATQAAKAQTFDKWMVLTDKGTIKAVNIVDPTKPPKNVIKYAGVTPVTQGSFNTYWKQTYADDYNAYTGHNATGKQIAAILTQAPSVYTLRNQLASDPGSGFMKSPIWKAHAPGLIAIARSILGDDWKPSGGIIRKTIAGGVDPATFEAEIRALPAYEKGPEFKTNLAHNQAAYEQIYGKADPAVLGMLKERTKAGWTPDELQSWLRSQDAYKNTPEYQAKSVSFLTQLGLITGGQATLSSDQVDKMLNDNPFPAKTTATGPGAAPNRPDNRPGPRGANPGQTPIISYPSVRPDDRAGVRRP